MTTVNAPHDALFWSTIVQACGSVVIVIATIALVWVTALLVKATKKLAQVGEQTWKSNIIPNVWIHCDEGRYSSKEDAVVNIRNSCAVDLTNVRCRMVPMAFWVDSDGDYTDDAILIDDAYAVDTLQLGSLNATDYKSISFWDAAIASIDVPLASKSQTDAEAKTPRHVTVVPGFFLNLAFVQSVTNETYTKFVRYVVKDLGRASIHVSQLNEDDSAVLR